ncbi:hypothetical protein CF7_0141 [Staphylococcus phage CF7]|nr:hypothetical protein CF7_0141 [Staphylococcus phage CF7]
MFKLQNKVELIVPKEDNNGVEIDNLAIRVALETITKIAGGCTATDVKGQWWSDDEQRIMQDNNINFEWYYDKDMEDNDKEILSIELGRIIDILIMEYDQEGISIKLNNVLYIISMEDIDTLDEDYIKDELHDLMF